MRKIAAVLAVIAVGLIAMAPAADALLLKTDLSPVTVKVLEPNAPLIDVNLGGDVVVLPILNDPLVHVCIDGTVQSVLASVALNLHLDVLGSDSDCHPVTTVTTTPPSHDDPLVHVCVNGTVQSFLASVAANLHLDVLGHDSDCKPTTTVTTVPSGTDDPLVHVCVDGKVQSVLASVALNLHLDVLGSDNKCPVTTTTTKPPVTTTTTRPGVTTTTTGPGTTVTTIPGTTVTTGTTGTPTGNNPTTVTVKPAAKNTGPLAFTGNNWVRILFAAGLIFVLAGVVLRRLGKI